MLLKKITRLLGIAAIGLMMGSSVNYAVKGYGLLGATGDWAKLIASSIASSSSSSSDEIDCSKVDQNNYVCNARANFTTETVSVRTDLNGNASFTWGEYRIDVRNGDTNSPVTVSIIKPECLYHPKNLCEKSFIKDNKPYVRSASGSANATILL